MPDTDITVNKNVSHMPLIFMIIIANVVDIFLDIYFEMQS